MGLGYRSAAAEVLTRFSALFDFPGAAVEGAVLGLAVLLGALPLALPASARLASPALARAAGEHRRRRVPGLGALFGAGLALTVLLGLGLPLVGIALPFAAARPETSRAAETAVRTGVDTLAYGLGAGATATALAALLGLAVGRSSSLRRLALGACLVCFALPASLPALGLVQSATAAPAWADPVLRSRFTVAAALGLRTFPVAAVLMLRAWASLPTSWAGAAAVHGVSLSRYLRSVLVPALAPSAALSVLLAALLATADVGTVLLLHPPGHPSLPLALFTIMANAPEAQVASLGLLYLLLAGAGLGLAFRLAARRPW
jgi:ABC-type Fe3+ transport system permease subunit